MTGRHVLFGGALLVTCGVAAGLVVAGRMPIAGRVDAQVAPPPRPATPSTAPAPAPALPDFSRVAERTVPAVVNVSAQQVVLRRGIPNDPFFPFGTPGELFGTRRGVENSLGSGVIVSSDGYILTNNHVVVGESQPMSIEQLDVTVSLADKREMRATLVGIDPATDLALLKIDSVNLPTIPWGDSTRLKVAEWVLAIGNPYQLNQTVTLGIVSAVGRTNVGASSYEDFVQTDAAINPGNSGGALVNARGELVGINTVIFSRSGGYQGIGFAVSSNLARRVASDLRQYREVRRGSVGYYEGAPLTTRRGAELGLGDTRGVEIQVMARNSPAYQGGLRPGDIVLAFNGTAVEDPAHLWRLISDAQVGSTAKVTVLRQGKRLDLQLPIARLTGRQG